MRSSRRRRIGERDRCGLADGTETPLQPPGEGRTTDGATLYLCRQGPTWVVVIESPGITGAVRLRHSGRDPYDARSELLSMARRACPGAAIVSADGALESADYEWRLEVRGVEAREGDLGLAIHHALSTEAPAPRETAPTTRVGPPLPLGPGPRLGPATLVLTTAFLAAAAPTTHAGKRLSRAPPRRAPSPSRWSGTSRGARPSSR